MIFFISTFHYFAAAAIFTGNSYVLAPILSFFPPILNFLPPFLSLLPVIPPPHKRDFSFFLSLVLSLYLSLWFFLSFFFSLSPHTRTPAQYWLSPHTHMFGFPLLAVWLTSAPPPPLRLSFPHSYLLPPQFYFPPQSDFRVCVVSRGSHFKRPIYTNKPFMVCERESERLSRIARALK